MNVKLITDSTSSISKEYLEKENIGYIESKVMLGDKELKELTEIDRNELIENIPKFDPYPTTTIGSPGEASEIFEQAFKDGYEEIFYIGVSPTISNQYNSTKLAAKKNGKHGKSTLYECGLSTSSQGALVYNANKLLKKGIQTDQIIENLEIMKKDTFTIGISPSFETMYRTGKIQKSAKLSIFSTLLKLKPMYEIVLNEGAKGIGAGKGFKGAISKAIEKLTSAISENQEYDLILTYANNTKYFDLIEKKIKEKIKIKDVIHWKIAPCVMLSTGVESFQITIVPHID